MNKYGKHVPIGVSGELCVGGIGVARGYVNAPEKTAEKYIFHYLDSPLPGGRSLPERIYKTGDLVRQLVDGNIEFLGRLDHQVKVKGFRVELHEIENQLLQFEGIRECVVVVRESPDTKTGKKNSRENRKNQYLCSYFVSNKKIKSSLEAEVI